MGAKMLQMTKVCPKMSVHLATWYLKWYEVFCETYQSKTQQLAKLVPFITCEARIYEKDGEFHSNVVRSPLSQENIFWFH
jgi:hypothetical protein